MIVNENSSDRFSVPSIHAFETKTRKKKWLLLRSEILSEISIYTRIRRYWISNQRFSKICINNKTTSRVNWNCLQNDNNNKMCRGPPQPLLLLRLSRWPLVAYCFFFSARVSISLREKLTELHGIDVISAESRVFNGSQTEFITDIYPLPYRTAGRPVGTLFSTFLTPLKTCNCLPKRI